MTLVPRVGAVRAGWVMATLVLAIATTNAQTKPAPSQTAAAGSFD